MHHARKLSHHRVALLATALAATMLAAACGGGDDAAPAAPPQPVAPANQLYTETNETANAIVHFTRQADGTLLRQETTPTGGAGTNAVNAAGNTVPDSLVSQHSVIASPDGSTLFVVNGGDDSISVMKVDASTGALTLKKRSSTAAGHIPNSLALNHGVLYATFIGGASQLAAFRVEADGGLTQLGSYDLLALGGLATAAPTQVIVSPDGGFAVVSAGTGSNAILSFPIAADGTLGTPVSSAGVLATPFAGAFVPGAASPVYLSTGISTQSLNAFSFSATGALAALGQASAPGTAAPCWLVVTPDGKTAFVGNGSGSISSYAINGNTLTLLDATAALEPSAQAGINSVAADSWISPDGKYLYTAYLGDDKVVAYAIGLNGSLAKLGETVIGTATKLSLQGLVGF
jgi:6-phosphogluconolactonase (cycloisomerase 2 family)